VGRHGRAEQVDEEDNDPDGDYVVDLVETFFANFDMR